MPRAGCGTTSDVPLPGGPPPWAAAGAGGTSPRPASPSTTQLRTARGTTRRLATGTDATAGQHAAVIARAYPRVAAARNARVARQTVAGRVVRYLETMSAFIAIAGLLLLVLVHEAGHFVAA